ncbi:polyprenol phosphomannose-dependent alpha 1,6 mannosyltransferase MptB [Nesterenkonia muleiensis]|uniref:polyprenol phosphomannose-dependent alpha 1,6 mannosyltransferase MptB n=1 Tax=Nesterenkonia muleiensis TaxID=2282648 RepID=UPI000E71F14F|nr:polyprenol phosphomannose-dependent alpha 1,6 mannosyltransferase MptB [Nesterenkonia muleiensis]
MTRQTRAVIGYGLVGSLLILTGSFGVGWLVADSPVARWAPTIWLRTEPAGVVVSVIALSAGCWVLFHAWLRLRTVMEHDGAPASLRTATSAALVWAAPQLLVVPIFSRDVFAYLNQGRLVLAGENPYTTGVSTLENWFQLGTDIIWAEDATPYGPLFLWIAAAVMRISGDSAELAILLFRVVCVLGMMLILIMVPVLARVLGADPAAAQWVTTANPLLIISFVSSAHNDALMVGFALAGTWCAIRAGQTAGSAHWLLGAAAVALMVASIGTKLITLVMLPFIALLWAGAGSSWPRTFGYWFLTAGLSGAALLGIGALGGYGFDWVTVLAGAGTGATFWAPLTILAAPIAGALLAFGHSPDPVFDVVSLIGRLAAIAVVLYLMFRGGEHRVFQRMMWAFAAVVVLSPLIQPWYLLWILPLFAAAGAITGTARRWPLALTAAITGFLLAQGAADQLFVHQFLDIQVQMTVLSAAVSAACAAAIWFLDPGARSVVLRGEPAAD